MRRAWLAICLAACGGTDGDEFGDFTTIEVEPATANLTVALGSSATQAYQIYGVTRGGRSEITSRCSLAVDPQFGAFTDATMTVLPHGGKTSVVAACGPHSAQGLLVVNLVGTVVLGPDTPPNAGDIFTSATPGVDPARSPAIEYPLDKAVSPRNIPSIEVQWTAAGNDLFHVSMSSTFAKVEVYTTAVEALLAAPDWEALVGSVAGEDMAFAIEGLARAAPQTKYAAAPIAVRISHDAIDKTAIYYWASSQGNIMSQTFGDPTPPALVKDDCTSCHSVSRAGSRIGYSRCVGGRCGADLFFGFLKYDPVARTWKESVNANDRRIRGSYSTFAPIGNPFPTDDQALALVSMEGGLLALFDPDTGAAVASNIAIARNGPGAPRSALMADWSADGKRVVFTSSSRAGDWIDLDGGRIATMTYTYSGGQHVFGEPTFIVPDPITLPGGVFQNFFFPSFSSDGALVVFNAARSAWRSNPARTAGQRLMLADANGAWITDLTAMNGGNGDFDITWPHWAPTISSEYYWVVFSSERDYGHRTTVGTSPASCKQNGVEQCKQIWLGAIAKSRLGAGMDPSAPPMWLPGQSAQANNISPYWSVPSKLQ